MKTKSKIEIIQETAEYYGEDPKERRAVITVKDSDGDYCEGNSCEYCTEDGRECAFGRCCISSLEAQKRIGKNTNITMLDFDFNELLKDEYRGHGVEFWNELQRFHDSDEYWDQEDTGLSERGQIRYSQLLDECRRES